jgi:hypothetical protein
MKSMANEFMYVSHELQEISDGVSFSDRVEGE